ncbi:hypothetical protein ACK8HX_14665 [Oryzobacter sp. R7]|uniref:hypothetical protein n=1 Tax=Oryzobacter faecalis TaxID=3388656 RepID=UPI00398D092D
MRDDGARPATSAAPIPRRRPTRATWLAAVAAGLVTALLLRVRTTPDVDLWLHLRTGELLRAGERFGALPDPMAALADRTYVPTQWLAQVAMSLVHDASGTTGIEAARLLLVLALGAAVLLASRAVAGPGASLLATALTMLGAAAAWGERPQLAGVVLLALVVAAWWWASERGRVPWVVVPLTWLWATVHGSWLVGIGAGVVVLVGGALDRRWTGRRLVLVAAVPVLSVAAAAATPLGTAAVLEPFRISSVAGLTANEWQRPTPGNPLLLVVLVACVLALLGVVRSRRRRWTRVLSVAAALVLALAMVRTIATAAVVLAPALAHGLDDLGGRLARAGRDDPSGATPSARGARVPGEWMGWALAAGVLLAVGGWHVATTPFGPPVSERVSAAVAVLPPDAVLAVDGKAVGWVEWAHPDRRPLRDLRAEVYSVPVATDYERFQEAEAGWSGLADRYGVTAVLADRDRPLDAALAGEPAWRVAAEDPDFRLWVRP